MAINNISRSLLTESEIKELGAFGDELVSHMDDSLKMMLSLSTEIVQHECSLQTIRDPKLYDATLDLLRSSEWKSQDAKVNNSHFFVVLLC